MFDSFIEYVWYLLSSPFKLVAKPLNQWYIFARVVGRWFDEVKDDLQRARDETTIVTCSDIMLRYHAEDRSLNLTQYPGESNDSFRSRIAMYDELVKKGGTRDGLILAANTLGYSDVEYQWIPAMTGDTSRWAEFCLIIHEDIANPMPVSFAQLVAEIRDKKESDSLDNYEFDYHGEVSTAITEQLYYFGYLAVNFYQGSRMLNGGKLLDGSKELDGHVGNLDLLSNYLAELVIDELKEASLSAEGVMEAATQIRSIPDYTGSLAVNFYQGSRMLNSGKLLDGSKELDGHVGNLDLLSNYLAELVIDELKEASLSAEGVMEAATQIRSIPDYTGSLAVNFYQGSRMLNGGKLLDGSKELYGCIGDMELRSNYLAETSLVIISELMPQDHLMEAVHVQTAEAELETSGGDCFYGNVARLDGSRKLDGSHLLDAHPGCIEATLERNNVIIDL